MPIDLTAFLDDTLGLGHPLTYATLFLAASGLLVWRLEAVLARGLEGTAAGALLMPLCSGLGNLGFVLMARRHGVAAAEVATNALANNLTNLLVIVPGVALLSGLALRAPAGEGKGARPRKKAGAGDPAMQASLRALSLHLTLGAAALFALIAWALAQDGRLDEGDGLALCGLFALWQAFHFYDVRKHQLTQRRRWSPWIVLDVFLALAAAALMLVSLDWLVRWLAQLPGGSFAGQHLGWLTAWLMVLPNAALALYYAVKRRADIVYASQVGDGHICIPLCLGLGAVFSPGAMPAWLPDGLLVLAGAAGAHALGVLICGGLPRWLAPGFFLAYGWCLQRGLG
jgi:cation:H+ antiporter